MSYQYSPDRGATRMVPTAGGQFQERRVIRGAGARQRAAGYAYARLSPQQRAAYGNQTNFRTGYEADQEEAARSRAAAQQQAQAQAAQARAQDLREQGRQSVVGAVSGTGNSPASTPHGVTAGIGGAGQISSRTLLGQDTGRGRTSGRADAALKAKYLPDPPTAPRPAQHGNNPPPNLHAPGGAIESGRIGVGQLGWKVHEPVGYDEKTSRMDPNRPTAPAYKRPTRAEIVQRERLRAARTPQYHPIIGQPIRDNW